MANESMTKAHCNRCGPDTNHRVLHSEHTEGHDVVDEEHGIEINWWDQYDMLKCAGCDAFTMRHTAYFSETDDAPRVVYYPPVIARRTPGWIGGLESLFIPIPGEVEELLQEVYTAVQNDSRRLAAMGIRAALEHVMIAAVGDQRTFGANITAFQQQGHIAPKQAESLAAILDAGHATIHRGWNPTSTDITTLLDITESIISTVYIHPGKVKSLQENVPVRTRRQGLPEEGRDD